MSGSLDHGEIYDLIGGEETFANIVEYFYETVADDELLRPLYPEKLDMAKTKLKLFLIKKFGGPDDYTPLRGHPRMRRRHMKFDIGIPQRNRWVEIMGSALEKAGIDHQHPARATLQEYFEWMATHLINQQEFLVS